MDIRKSTSKKIEKAQQEFKLWHRVESTPPRPWSQTRTNFFLLVKVVF